MKSIKVGDKGEYGYTINPSAVKDILKRFNSLDLYHRWKLETYFSETHQIDEVIKVSDLELKFKVTCIEDCYYYESIGRFFTEEKHKEFLERNKNYNT